MARCAGCAALTHILKLALHLPSHLDEISVRNRSTVFWLPALVAALGCGFIGYEAEVRPIGAGCVTGGECASGFCADGVCCDTACSQSCHACDVMNRAGTCTAVPRGPSPRNQCPADATNTCGSVGLCDGEGACVLQSKGVECNPGTCQSGAEAVGRCDGLGKCETTMLKDCGGFTCDDAVKMCRTLCSDASHCQTGVCSTGRCMPSSSLALYWKLDDASADSVAIDSSGKGHHGSYLVTGAMGSPIPSRSVAPVLFPNPWSRQFSMARSHAVHLAAIPAALKPANNFSLSGWFRTTMIDETYGSEIVSAGDQYMLRIRTKNMVEFAKRVTNAAGTGAWIQCFANDSNPLDGGWHHAAGVSTPAGMKVYVDGVERCSNTAGGDVRYDRGPDLYVGRHGTINRGKFEGEIDDVRVYTRALTAADVMWLAQGNP
jgi:hypothetical protein